MVRPTMYVCMYLAVGMVAFVVGVDDDDNDVERSFVFVIYVFVAQWSKIV